MTAMTASILQAKNCIGKVAAVTGAASGDWLCQRPGLADAGARVVLIDRDEAALAQACAAIGERALPLVLGLLDAKQCQLLQRTLALAGPLDIFTPMQGSMWAAIWSMPTPTPSTAC